MYLYYVLLSLLFFIYMLSFSLLDVDLDFECDENDTIAREIVGKILNLHVADRLWSNYLNCP